MQYAWITTQHTTYLIRWDGRHWEFCTGDKGSVGILGAVTVEGKLIPYKDIGSAEEFKGKRVKFMYGGGLFGSMTSHIGNTTPVDTVQIIPLKNPIQVAADNKKK